MLYLSVFIFIVTFNTRACDRCVLKLYDPCYRCKKTSYSDTSSTSIRSINNPGHAHSVALRQRT